LATGDDGDFEEGIGVFEEPAADSMAGFVVCDGLLLFGAENKRLLLQAADDTLDGLFKVFELNRKGARTCSYSILANSRCIVGSVHN